MSMFRLREDSLINFKMMYLILRQWFILPPPQIIIRWKQKSIFSVHFPELASSDLLSLSLIRHNAVVLWTLFPTGKLKSHFLLITCMILTNPRKANMPSPHCLLLIGLPPVQLLPFGLWWELCRHFACQFLYALGEVIKVERKFRNLIHTILLFVGWAWEQAQVISIYIYCMTPFLQIDTHWQPHTHMMRDLRIVVIHHPSFPPHKLNSHVHMELFWSKAVRSNADTSYKARECNVNLSKHKYTFLSD